MTDVLTSVRFNHSGWDRLKQNVYYREDVKKLNREERRILFKHERERTACNRLIFSQSALKASLRRQVIELEIGKNYSGFKLPGIGNDKGGVRGKITGFSGEARVRMLKDQASLVRYPRVWQDFTFADDIMGGRSISERAAFSSRVLKEFKRYMAKQYPGIWGTWKREWKERKSGKLLGEWCPHFHVLWDWDSLSWGKWAAICLDLAIKWVHLTGSQDPRAIAVAINEESYRWLSDTHMAQVYVSKYVAKVQMMETGGSLGRFWGRIGKPPMAPKENKALTFSEIVWLSRLLPRMTRRLGYKDPLEGLKRNEGLEKRLSKFSGWLMVSSETINRILIWISEQKQKEFRSKCLCPF